MSMSTPQGPKRPANVVTTRSSGTPAKKASTPAKKTSSGGSRPSSFKVEPVRVNQRRSWGPFVLWGAVIAVVGVILGYAIWSVYDRGVSWETKANRIDGIVDYRKIAPKDLTQEHKPGVLTYHQSPPVGGPHNQVWMRCLGDVYNAPIAKEHAVHSLEHGAVWITYRPDLPADQVKILADKVHKIGDFILMSPYPGLDKPISLQAWGYQLKLDKATDGRIDQFIKALRINAAMEPNTPCSDQGITQPGPTPYDFG